MGMAHPKGHSPPEKSESSYSMISLRHIGIGIRADWRARPDLDARAEQLRGANLGNQARNRSTSPGARSSLLMARPSTSGTIKFLPSKPVSQKQNGEIRKDGTFAVKTNDLDQAEALLRASTRSGFFRAKANGAGHVGLTVHGFRSTPNISMRKASELTASIKAETNELPPFR